MSTIDPAKSGAPVKYEPPFLVDDSVFRRLSATNNAASIPSILPAHPKSYTDNTLSLFLPIAFINDKKVLQTIDIADFDTVEAFVSQDLNVTLLNNIHNDLWLAGLPVRARPLHHQVLLGRSIVITERADLHLVWRDNTIYIKPLPEYLMEWRTWSDVICKERGMFEAANGMLLTYIWLICSKSDLKIAHDTGLISTEIHWDQWTSYTRSLLKHIDHAELHNINPRYLYGELRLSRLNLIYRFRFLSTSRSTLIRGYQYGYRQYSTFIERNFTWLLTAIVYITVVLTAMQVGLATDHLRNNTAFNKVSYGFTILSIIAPLAVLVIMILMLATLAIYNLLYTISQQKSKREQYPHVFENPSLPQCSVRSSRTRRQNATA